jgi:hypothetical protein
MRHLLTVTLVCAVGALAGGAIGAGLGGLSGETIRVMQGSVGMGTAGLLTAYAVYLHETMGERAGRRLSQVALALVVGAALACGVWSTYIEWGHYNARLSTCLLVLGGAIAGLVLAFLYEVARVSRHA